MLWLTLHFPRLQPPRPMSRPRSEAVAVRPATANSELSALACWAGRFTPQVSLGAGRISLELAASLRLFGGLPALLQQIRSDLERMSCSGAGIGLAVAPTPLAACWLARSVSTPVSDSGSLSDNETVCLDLVSTRTALEPLPLTVLELPPAQQARLESFGLRCVGQLLALPRAGIGQRLGQALVLELERALGELPDPQPWFEFPEQFDQTLELPVPVEAAPVLLFAARRLVAALAGWLAVRNGAVRELRFDIGYERHPGTTVPLAFSTPVHAGARIERVLRQRLDALSLPAAAIRLRLRAAQPEVRNDESQALFDGGACSQDRLAELLDRLVARLGVDGVQRVTCHADHRPEAASRFSAPGAAGTGSIPPPEWPQRPLWLLDPPQSLPEVKGRPSHGGRMQLLAGPERIEAGWWDGTPACRDYFIAMDGQQRWCWIFRDPHTPAGWFLHGWFA